MTATAATVAVVALGTLNASIAGAYTGLGTGPHFCARAERGGYPLSGISSNYRGPRQINNVYACGPLPIARFDYGPRIATFWPTSGYVQGGGFQCTEYASRYLYQATGGHLLSFDNLSGEGFARRAAQELHLTLTSSTSGKLPKAGDIISEAFSRRYPAANVGDVAVVANVDHKNHLIWIFGENDTNSGYNAISYSGKSWIINPGTSYTYTYFQWVDPTQRAKHVAVPPPNPHAKVIEPPLLTLKGASPSTQGSGGAWNLASDFLANPDLNPAPDRQGRPRVWSFMDSASLARNGAYSLLPNHVSNFESSSGTQGWSGTQASGCSTGTLNLPVVAINTTARPTTGCGTWTVPPYVVDLHPAATQLAIVAWRSPIAGTVSINGGVASLDPFGGGGISYYVTTAGSTLIQGAIPDGRAAQFPPLRVPVVVGQLLYVMIAPPASGLGFNSTSLSLVITPGPAGWPAPTSYTVIGRSPGHPLAVRSGPGNGYLSRGALRNGTRVRILCQAKGSLVANRSAIWDQIAVGEWVSDYYVDTPGIGTFSSRVTTCPG